MSGPKVCMNSVHGVSEAHQVQLEQWVALVALKIAMGPYRPVRSKGGPRLRTGGPGEVKMTRLSAGGVLAAAAVKSGVSKSEVTLLRALPRDGAIFGGHGRIY